MSVKHRRIPCLRTSIQKFTLQKTVNLILNSLKKAAAATLVILMKNKIYNLHAIGLICIFFFGLNLLIFFLVRSMTFLLQTRFSVRKTSAFRFSEVSCPKRKWFTGDVATSSLTPSFHSFSHFITATVHWIFKNIFWKNFLDLHNPWTLIGGFDLKRFFKKI